MGFYSSLSENGESWNSCGDDQLRVSRNNYTTLYTTQVSQVEKDEL